MTSNDNSFWTPEQVEASRLKFWGNSSEEKKWTPEEVEASLEEALGPPSDLMPEPRRRAILAEARRRREQCCSIPFYKKAEERDGPRLWVRLAVSYAGDE
jgi:hypothetical protein